MRYLQRHFDAWGLYSLWEWDGLPFKVVHALGVGVICYSCSTEKTLILGPFAHGYMSTDLSLALGLICNIFLFNQFVKKNSTPLGF